MLFKQKLMKHNRLGKNNQGMTLIEVIAVVAILGVVMAAVTGFMISGTKMSARVSDTATDSMKKQTAVEYINRWILDAESVTVSEKTTELDLGYGPKDYYTKLELGEIVLFTDEDENVVQYQISENEPNDLFSGEIYFEYLNENTLAYYFKDGFEKGERHVVHLRSGTITTESE